MRTVRMIVFCSLFALTGFAHARTPVRVIDYPSTPVVAGSGETLSAEEVCKVVHTAATGRNWTVSGQQNPLSASYSWNGGKHVISVNIQCAATSYSITYKDSINMKYSHRGGDATIHPHYNRFVGELKTAIQNAFQGL